MTPFQSKQASLTLKRILNSLKHYCAGNKLLKDLHKIKDVSDPSVRA